MIGSPQETYREPYRLPNRPSAAAAPSSPLPTPSFPVCLLPGPVALSERVQAALREPLVYHRSDDFLYLFRRVRERLAALAGKPAAIFVGSGTLANDAVAATLAAEGRDARGPTEGLVLVGGEFGNRLRNQARRWGLRPRVLGWEWGRPWDLAEVEAALRTMPAGGWVWGAHHETSTGVLNDLPALVALARRHGQRVCVDCVSSLGTVPVDLSGVYLASGTSGKALGSYAGLAFVFADPNELKHLDPALLPTYLDVPSALANPGPRFTVPSPLVLALDAALEPYATAERRLARFAQLIALGRHLRDGLRRLGLVPLAADGDANPSVVTFAPPCAQTTAEFVARCLGWGYLVAGRSDYLAERRLVQVAVMGAVGREHVDGLLERLG